MEQTIDLYILGDMPSRAKACAEGRNWFEKVFEGGGADLREAWDLLKKSDVPKKVDWLVWFGCNWLPVEDVDDFSYFVIGLAMDAVGDPQWANNATPENYSDLYDAYGGAVGFGGAMLLRLPDYVDNGGEWRSDFYPNLTPKYGDEMVAWLESRVFTD